MKRFDELSLCFAVSAGILIAMYLSGLYVHLLFAFITIASAASALVFAFAAIETAIRAIDLKGLSSIQMLKGTVRLGIYGAIIATLIVVFGHLNVTEAVGVYTVAAEALGFIGLSLVEVTILKVDRRQKPPRFPSSR